MPPQKKYTLEEFEARLTQRGFAVRPISGPLASAHAARKAKQAAPRLSDPKLDLDLDLNSDNDDFGDFDTQVNPTSLDKNGGSSENPPAETGIVVHWCKKPRGSPGRGASGYNLKKVLRMPPRSYRLVLSGIKVLLMRQPGIDMTATISFQDEDILRHVLKKAAKQYPEFDIFASQGRWPLRAFTHAILRTSANLHQENSGQRQPKKKKAAEDHPPAVDQSMRDNTELLAGPPPLNDDQPRPADQSMHDGQPPVPDESMRAGDEPPFGMDPPFGDDPNFHIQPESDPEPLLEEPALPPGVFDDDDDEEPQDHAVTSVLKHLGNVTLDSIDGEDGGAVSSAATHTNHPAQGESAPPAPKSTPPACKSAQPASLATKPTPTPASQQQAVKAAPARAPAQAPTRKPSPLVEADPPTAKPAPQTTRAPASRTPTTQSPSVRAPAQAPAGKSATPSSAPAAPPVCASKLAPTISPDPPAPTPGSDDEGVDIAADMLAKLERMAQNPKYRARIPVAYKALIDKLYPVADDVATSTTALAPTTTSAAVASTVAPKTNSRPKPKMRPAPEPKVPEVDESDLSDVSASLSNPPVDPEQEAAPSPPPAKKGPGRPKKGAVKGAGVGEAAKDTAGVQGAKRGRKAAGPANGDAGKGGGTGKKTATKGKAAKVPVVPTRHSPRNIAK
ncbi:hypothetical protein FRC10_004565 [Ceratobasidium sp. 414]|nr:hypothetical protein FRC10_004565 [Ceratobasidium sp. 414]